METKLIETTKGRSFLGWSADSSRKIRVPLDEVREARSGEPTCEECNGYLHACGFIWVCTLCGNAYGRKWVKDRTGVRFLKGRTR